MVILGIDEIVVPQQRIFQASSRVAGRCAVFEGSKGLLAHRRRRREGAQHQWNLDSAKSRPQDIATRRRAGREHEAEPGRCLVALDARKLADLMLDIGALVGEVQGETLANLALVGPGAIAGADQERQELGCLRRRLLQRQLGRSEADPLITLALLVGWGQRSIEPRRGRIAIRTIGGDVGLKLDRRIGVVGVGEPYEQLLLEAILRGGLLARIGALALVDGDHQRLDLAGQRFLGIADGMGVVFVVMAPDQAGRCGELRREELIDGGEELPGPDVQVDIAEREQP